MSADEPLDEQERWALRETLVEDLTARGFEVYIAASPSSTCDALAIVAGRPAMMVHFRRYSNERFGLSFRPPLTEPPRSVEAFLDHQKRATYTVSLDRAYPKLRKQPARR